MEEFKTVSFKAEINDWNLFKKITKKLNSDNSKELRKFIKEYIKKNKEVTEKLF